MVRRYEMIDFPIGKQHFRGSSLIRAPWEPPGRKKRGSQMYLQDLHSFAPLRSQIFIKNIELNQPPNFERLVLGCIEADFCNQILVGKLSPRSTRFAFLCTAQIAKFRQKTVRLFAKLNIEYSIFLRWFNLILLFFCEISMKFCRNFATNLRK